MYELEWYRVRGQNDETCVSKQLLEAQVYFFMYGGRKMKNFEHYKRGYYMPPVQSTDWVNKEYLKCNAFDFISILIRNAKGQVYTILEMELCQLNRL